MKASMTQAVLPQIKILDVWSLGYSFSYTSFSPVVLQLFAKLKALFLGVVAVR